MASCICFARSDGDEDATGLLIQVASTMNSSNISPSGLSHDGKNATTTTTTTTTATGYDNVEFTTTPEVLFHTSMTIVSDLKQPLWSRIMDYAQLAMTSVGVAANLVTYVTLYYSGKYFGDSILLILKNQSILDFLVCVTGALLLAFPPLWTTGAAFTLQIPHQKGSANSFSS